MTSTAPPPASAADFVQFDLELLMVEDPLPGDLFLKIDSRHIKYRNKGDVIDRNTWDRLEFKKVDYIFVRLKENDLFIQWAMSRAMEEVDSSPKTLDFRNARSDMKRKTMDIFQSEHPTGKITPAFTASKRLVGELLKNPYTRKSINHLTSLARGTVDHSVNVGVLSGFLALQMGYTHQGILQNVTLGGLLHDIGKKMVNVEDSDPPEVVAIKMFDHPMLGSKLLEKSQEISNEVRMIVAQHHEFQDGTGFPRKLRGMHIYDLARIVSMANVFDELVSKQKAPTLPEKQRMALFVFERDYYKKYDADKFAKAIKLLKAGI